MFNFDEWGINFEALKQESYIEPAKTSFIDFDDMNDVINLRKYQCEQKPMGKFLADRK